MEATWSYQEDNNWWSYPTKRRRGSRNSLWKTWSCVWDMMVVEERLNKDLTMMNHASEKCKWNSWHRGIKYDGEEQVNVWVWDINHAMLSHKDMIKTWGKMSWLYRSKKSIVSGSRQSCSSQDHVETLKLWQRWESGKKKNQVDKLKFILKCFYFLLEYRSSYYKEGCNMVILTKPKSSKPKEISRVM